MVIEPGMFAERVARRLFDDTAPHTRRAAAI
jgi:hypothetical protein